MYVSTCMSVLYIHNNNVGSVIDFPSVCYCYAKGLKILGGPQTDLSSRKDANFGPLCPLEFSIYALAFKRK